MPPSHCLEEEKGHAIDITMFSRSFRATTSLAPRVRRTFSTLDDTAKTAVEKSCYLKIDFRINESAPVIDAIQRMAANRIGALAVTDANNKIIGIVSERDYLCKVALLGKSSRNTAVGEISTYGEANLITVFEDEPIDECMKKLLSRDIRHLLVRSRSNGVITWMFSIKDVGKCVVARNTEVVQRLTNFATGKGAFFSSTD